MRAARLLMTAAASAVLAGAADAQLPDPSPAGVVQESREAPRRNLGRLRGPLSALTGGVIPAAGPTTPTAAELLDAGVIGAASKAKLDRAGAEERVRAVQYLATLDCHYWPEAEDALVAALRGDRNECVRYEAAAVLSRGCCCTCKAIVALSHAVACSEADGYPYEKSARVRAVAANALDRCMTACNCTTADPPATGPDPQRKGDADSPKAYYARVAKLPRDKVGAFGHRALEIGANIGYTSVGEVNPRDYAAAGLPAARDGQSSGAKPTTLWELMTWKDTDAAIGKPLVGPPAARPAGATAPAPPPEKLVPVGPATVVSPPAVVGAAKPPAAAPRPLVIPTLTSIEPRS